ncbi:MAG: hypothetical protein LHV69_05735 [Elusimicrobia bacterium]|nr:hypothetical protein [Candidatus Obscuribacterium magneticum]
MPPEEAVAIRANQRRWQVPKPPRIQTMLELAGQWQSRLDQTPGLKRAALAQELKLNPTYLTRHLNLLKLAPEIQRFIRGLPLSLTKGPIAEWQLMPIARNSDHEKQKQLFEGMLVSISRRKR